MPLPFSADEIFEIAIRIEQNGKDFYTEAAKAVSTKTEEVLFTELSKWEKKHVELFQKMKSELPKDVKKQTVFDPDSELSAYLEAAADTHIFIKSKSVSQLVESCQSPSEALDLAVSFEKDSVIYYTAMRKVIPSHLGRDNIEILIDEELQHISLLNKKKL